MAEPNCVCLPKTPAGETIFTDLIPENNRTEVVYHKTQTVITGGYPAVVVDNEIGIAVTLFREDGRCEFVNIPLPCEKVAPVAPDTYVCAAFETKEAGAPASPFSGNVLLKMEAPVQFDASGKAGVWVTAQQGLATNDEIPSVKNYFLSNDYLRAKVQEFIFKKADARAAKVYTLTPTQNSIATK